MTKNVSLHPHPGATPMHPTITLNAIRQHSPCQDGWKKLLSHLDKTAADDEPFPLSVILDSNGLQDTLWCFRALGPEWSSWARLTIADIVQPAMKYTTDPRAQKALDVSKAFARGEVTEQELENARAAAYAAADAAARAAAYAAADGASAAARTAAYAAAQLEQEQILRRAL